MDSGAYAANVYDLENLQSNILAYLLDEVESSTMFPSCNASTLQTPDVPVLWAGNRTANGTGPAQWMNPAAGVGNVNATTILANTSSMTVVNPNNASHLCLTSVSRTSNNATDQMSAMYWNDCNAPVTRVLCQFGEEKTLNSFCSTWCQFKLC